MGHYTFKSAMIESALETLAGLIQAFKQETRRTENAVEAAGRIQRHATQASLASPTVSALEAMVQDLAVSPNLELTAAAIRTTLASIEAMVFKDCVAQRKCRRLAYSMVDDDRSALFTVESPDGPFAARMPRDGLQAH